MFRLTNLRAKIKTLKYIYETGKTQYDKEVREEGYEKLFAQISAELAKRPRTPEGWANPQHSRYLRRKVIHDFEGPWYV